MVNVILKILKTYLQLLKTNNIDEYETYLEQLYKLQNEFDRHSAIKYQDMMNKERETKRR